MIADGRDFEKKGQRTPEDIQELKDKWRRDPCWDIETTEGFEYHGEELLAYRHECEALWDKMATARHDIQLSKICFMGRSPHVGETRSCHCYVEKCAAWDFDRDCCGMLPYKEVRITGGISTHPY